MRRNGKLGTLVIGTLLGVAASLGAGCAGWSNYPAIGADDGAINDVNVTPQPEVIATALRWATRRSPIGGPYAINLPEGMKRRTAERILTSLNDPDARLVGPSTENLPRYHVTRVWVRGERATVEVLRPVMDVPSRTAPPLAEDGALYQGFTIKLYAGWQPWKVESSRAWPVGAAEPPALHAWPEDYGTAVGGGAGGTTGG